MAHRFGGGTECEVGISFVQVHPTVGDFARGFAPDVIPRNLNDTCRYLVEKNEGKKRVVTKTRNNCSELLAFRLFEVRDQIVSPLHIIIRDHLSFDDLIRYR